MVRIFSKSIVSLQWLRQAIYERYHLGNPILLIIGVDCRLPGSVPQCETTCPTMTQNYLDIEPLSLAHGTHVFISELLSLVVGRNVSADLVQSY